MPITPEDRARQSIDQLLTAAGWTIQDRGAANITAGRGVAIREFPIVDMKIAILNASLDPTQIDEWRDNGYLDILKTLASGLRKMLNRIPS